MVNAISLFSGAGGFCEGTRLAGWKVLCSVEADDHACLTYAANFPGVPLFRGDIGRFLVEKQTGVPEVEQLLVKGVDVVYGGPPCQGFSQIGPRDPNDPRNALYKQFVRVVRRLQPKVIVMENVPNMVTMKGGHFKDEVLKGRETRGLYPGRIRFARRCGRVPAGFAPVSGAGYGTQAGVNASQIVKVPPVFTLRSNARQFKLAHRRDTLSKVGRALRQVCAWARVSNFIGADTGMLLSVSGVEALSFPRRVLSGEIGNWCSDSSTKSAPASTKKSSVCFELSALARLAPGCQSQSPFEHVCKMADLQTLALSTPFACRRVDQPGER